MFVLVLTTLLLGGDHGEKVIVGPKPDASAGCRQGVPACHVQWVCEPVCVQSVFSKSKHRRLRRAQHSVCAAGPVCASTFVSEAVLSPTAAAVSVSCEPASIDSAVCCKHRRLRRCR